MQALPVVGSVIGGLFANDAAETQADATRDAANTASSAANPHLAWQQEVAIPYLTKILASQQNLPSNKVREDALGALGPIMELLKGRGLPSVFDPNSRDALAARRLRDVGMNELTDRSDSPMNFSSYRDREALAALGMSTITNPMSFLQGPYKEFFDKAGEQAIERSAAAKGQLNSGQLLSNLGLFSGKEAQSSLQSFLANLTAMGNQRGQQFISDEDSARQAMTSGNSMLAALMDQANAKSASEEQAIVSRLGTLGNIFNLTNTAKSDPFFDKLVSLAGGNPAAAAQAITQGNQTASTYSLGGTKALTDAIGKAGTGLWAQITGNDSNPGGREGGTGIGLPAGNNNTFTNEFWNSPSNTKLPGVGTSTPIFNWNP